MNQNGQKWPKWPKVTPKWQVEKLFWQVDKLSIMECEEFIFSDWSPPDNPIQSERASSSIMECEEFILPDWSPFDDPASRIKKLHFSLKGMSPSWITPREQDVIRRRGKWLYKERGVEDWSILTSPGLGRGGGCSEKITKNHALQNSTGKF